MQYFLCFHYVHFFLNLICLACIVVILCAFIYLICICCSSLCAYLFFMCVFFFMCVSFFMCVFFLYVCIAVFTLDAGLLARSQYSEGPATGHLDTGFSWFPCVYKQMLRWFPTFQVATTCFSCSPPDLNLLVINFMFCIHVK